MLEGPSILWYYGDMTPSKNPSGAVNEQGSLAVDLAWFAGHVDGDGWIGINRRMRSSKQRYYRYEPSLMIVTTSDRNHEKSRDVLDAVGVKSFSRETAAYIGSDGSRRRAKYTLSVVGLASTSLLLPMLIPYLAEKREVAKLVLEYSTWRLSTPINHGGRGRGSWASDMTDVAEELMERIRMDRNRHDPSETTRLEPVARSRRAMT